MPIELCLDAADMGAVKTGLAAVNGWHNCPKAKPKPLPVPKPIPKPVQSVCGVHRGERKPLRHRLISAVAFHSATSNYKNERRRKKTKQKNNIHKIRRRVLY
eukprot:TRINITY_DN4247_c1_g3_i2.p1 TRINITY_DN4247_c1_g3~~TRINITY_DN4247_c1_g3_i2.p1  ORF type:complete len:102 (+),score=2.20 TRINITY_DN4247_c1_g3_i2:67-372(+)